MINWNIETFFIECIDGLNSPAHSLQWSEDCTMQAAKNKDLISAWCNASKTWTNYNNKESCSSSVSLWLGCHFLSSPTRPSAALLSWQSYQQITSSFWVQSANSLSTFYVHRHEVERVLCCQAERNFCWIKRRNCSWQKAKVRRRRKTTCIAGIVRRATLKLNTRSCELTTSVCPSCWCFCCL